MNKNLNHKSVTNVFILFNSMVGFQKRLKKRFISSTFCILKGDLI